MTEDSSELTLASPAKINVFLEVLGRRDDGFHELETVMLQTSLADQMWFRQSPTADVSLTLAPESDDQAARGFPVDSSNLIIKAARLLQQHAAARQGTTIRVRKRIPAEAGLAGGSSNAATTLLALNQLWQLNLPKEELHGLAAQLGSDVNFFIEQCRAAVCRGRGERVEPVSLGETVHVVAARPTQGNATPTVFRHTHLPETAARRSAETMVSALRHGSPLQIQSQTFNRLTEAAAAGNPSMQDLMELMATVLCRPAFMSGSGSTCFCYVDDPDQADSGVALLRQHGVPFVAAMTC